VAKGATNPLHGSFSYACTSKALSVAPCFIVRGRTKQATPESIAENHAKVESIEGFSEPGPFEPV
jgi:hypothetical protein